MNTEKNKNLYYLDDLSNYEVANEDKDVRGWNVKDNDGRIIGKVDNLLVNKATERVVYLDVEVDKSIIDANHKPYSQSAKDGIHEILNEDGDNHLIIPIGLAQLNLDSELVFINEINHQTFAETKRVKKGSPIYRDYEIIILDSYNRDKQAQEYEKDNAFYDRKEFKRKT
ncbi:photosystem reaction center subunit H [Gelidibacter salicanalis]|uniref:Photosystem reaction center subunit H n=1 Tax=Gelidibacter salicanalis TaxID=291193 RepID=A0A5C7AYI5_9FLAO|nr:PRC-barrel domain-containing protein [Gelidibacter salicanalis]TXE10772.1 photosystem reaction center subunit H [Gelidibacter salicanalis]